MAICGVCGTTLKCGLPWGKYVNTLHPEHSEAEVAPITAELDRLAFPIVVGLMGRFAAEAFAS